MTLRGDGLRLGGFLASIGVAFVVAFAVRDVDEGTVLFGSVALGLIVAGWLASRSRVDLVDDAIVVVNGIHRHLVPTQSVESVELTVIGRRRPRSATVLVLHTTGPSLAAWGLLWEPRLHRGADVDGPRAEIVERVRRHCGLTTDPT